MRLFVFSRRTAFGIFSLLVSSGALAQAPEGYETIYDAPTKVNLGGRPVIADIAYHTDRTAASQNDLRLVLTTDVTKFVDQTETDLQNWIAARRQDCGERWSSGEPKIEFPPNAIGFSLSLELEYWTCGWNGKSEPSLLTRETGSIEVTIIPVVIDGALQASLGELTVTEKSGVSKYLPLEFVLRRAVEQEINKLNANPKFYRAPKPLIDEGFSYQSIAATEDDDGNVVITAKYKAKGPAASLDRVVEKTRSEGITQ